MSVSENVAYLKGLMEGLDLDEDKKETKLFNAIIETLDEIASELSDMEEEMEDLSDYIEEIDEDLGDVEEYVYDEDDCDCDCCCDDDDCDCCDDDCLEVECPACENTVCIGFDEIDDDGEAECPCCGAILEFEIEEEEEIEE